MGFSKDEAIELTTGGPGATIPTGGILSVDDPKYRAGWDYFSDGSPPKIEEPAGMEGWTTLTPQKIVAMTTVGDRVFLATDHRVYELIEGRWHPMVFAVERPPVSE